LLEQPQAWEVVSFDDERRAPRGLAQLAPAW
jgi:UDP-3-O-[3-hydroxymyristoyl] N-acetylglucosamine deacetylase